jgi:phosphinothricin acetyltransferase
MNIRAAQADDFDAICEITNHYIRETTIHWGYAPVTADELRNSWLAKSERYPYLVGIDAGGGILGYAKAGPWRDRAAYARTAETGIYLRPESQGHGLGRLLYAALIAECRAAGFHTLVAGIALPNEASVRLHANFGFVHIGTFRQVGWKFDAWHDAAFYQLFL